MWPDIIRPGLRPDEAVALAIQSLPPGRPVSLTMDAWFPGLNWARAHKDIPVTIALDSTEHQDLMRIFTFELKKGEYRVFRSGPVILSVFEDNNTVRTISTAHLARSPFGIIPTPIQPSAAEVAGLEPLLSAEAVPILLQLSASDLKILAQKIGVPYSNATN